MTTNKSTREQSRLLCERSAKLRRSARLVEKAQLVRAESRFDVAVVKGFEVSGLAEG